MNRFLKFTGIFSGGILMVIVALYSWMHINYPNVGDAPHITVKGTPSQIERGRYLANHVTVCIDCHSTRDWSKFAGPVIPGSFGKGGEKFGEEMGFPGTFYSRNITPDNLKDWTDGEVFRLITTGVKKDGNPIFPVMPYQSYAYMDTSDVKAIIAYIRTLEPIDNQPPASHANFPMNLIERTIPQKARPLKRPLTSDTLVYGKYLTLIGGCGDCHTPRNQGQPIEGKYLAGGFVFEMPTGTVRSANITPDRKTGIGDWTLQQFISRFREYNIPYDEVPEIANSKFQTVMPWTMYGGMKEEDLTAIFKYLQSITPVNNEVEHFTPLTASN